MTLSHGRPSLLPQQESLRHQGKTTWCTARGGSGRGNCRRGRHLSADLGPFCKPCLFFFLKSHCCLSEKRSWHIVDPQTKTVKQRRFEEYSCIYHPSTHLAIQISIQHEILKMHSSITVNIEQ